MNRFQLVQVVIITLTLWIGYETFTYIFLFAEEFAISLDRIGGQEQGVIIYGINALVYTAIFFILIKKTSTLAAWVLSKTDLDPDVQLNVNASTFLFGIIVFWGLKIVVESGADVLSYGVMKFTETVKYQTGNMFRRPLISGCIKFIAGIILLRYAKPLSQYFEKQTDENDPHQIIGNVETHEN
jgi:hypothetical protein